VRGCRRITASSADARPGIVQRRTYANTAIDVVADLRTVGANLSDHTLGVLVYSVLGSPVPPGTGNHVDALAAVRPIHSDGPPPYAHFMYDNPAGPPRGRTRSDNFYFLEFIMPSATQTRVRCDWHPLTPAPHR